MYNRARVVFVSLFLAIAASVCIHAAGTYYGEVARVGNGVAYSQVKTSADGHPQSIAIVISEAALSNLPAVDAEYVLPIPSEVKVPPYNHLVLNWNVHGHDPTPIYGVPHFDYHFYLITRQAREKVMTTDNLKEADRNPGAAYVPKGYISSKEIIPAMGIHWVDPAGPEFNRQPFTRTFIYGYYKGQLTFLEPMATVKYFETHPDFSQPIKQPQKYRKPGYYPKSYSIKYNPNRAEYTISLDGLTYKR